MSKRIRFPRALLASILAVMVILLPVEIVASGASAPNPVGSGVAEVNGTGYGSFDEAFSAWSAGSTLKLLDDITTSSSITVPTGEHTLDLNGCGIKMTGNGSVFYIENGAKLNINDSNTNTTHKFEVPDGAGLASLNEVSGGYTVNGGYITGGNADNGGGIYIAEQGEVVMNGGALIGNHADDNGAGIRMDNYTTFTLNGGEIAYNESSTHGGGIGAAYTNHTTITVNDGAIHHNICQYSSGAITLDNDPDSYLYLYGGEIRDNASVSGSGNNPWHPGGIAGNANIHIKGGAKVCNNTNQSSSNNGTAKHNIELCLSENDFITLDGPLSEGATIAVSYHTGGNKTTGVITSGWSKYMGNADPADYFVSDYDDYIVSLNNGEAEIALPPAASIISGETTINYTSLSDAVSAWTAGSTLKLLDDIATSSSITVPASEHTLDLNGHGILMTGNDRVITINQGASLELNDSNPDRIHYITLTDYRGTAVSDSGEESVSNGNGVIKVTGGYLTGGYRNNTGNHDKCGAGVYNWGTFVMNGGSIVGNRLERNSGGAIRNSGYFTMNGGTIAFNKATGNGGGVTTYVPGGSQGKMTMNGGVISDNYCGSYGGGLQIAGPFEMTGGSVVRNTAATGGSGIFYDGKGEKFKLSGNPIIKDNTNNDLYLGTDATFMINGSLTEGADIHVFMVKPAEFTVGWKDNMGNAEPSDYFKSDDSNYIIIRNANGELEMIDKPAATVTSGDNTSYYSELSSALNAWTAGSTLKLMSDVTTSSTITVPSGEHTLDLNGCGIKMTGNGSVFVVGSGSKMIINDSNTDAEHKYTLSNTQSNGAGFATVNDSLTSGYKTFKGGYITGGNGNTRSSWREGGALHITGEVEMNAGTLIGNGKYGTTHGGGFETRDSGRFVMHGGSIQNNGGYCGGGCRLVGGSAEIDGGRIIDNIATNDGGGIHVGGTLPLVLKDCEISGNYANGGPGAGIWMSNVGTEISGKTVIKDNYVGNKADNIEIQKDKLIGIGNLTDGASIGITMQSGPAVFTSGWKDNMGEADPSKYFTSDNDSYKVFLNNNGEAEIGTPPVASITSGDTTTNYGSLSDAVNAWSAGSTLKLLTDVTTSSTITVPSGEHTLDLNGYTITRTGATGKDNTGLAMTVGDGVNLTVTGPGKITGGSGFHGGGIHVEGNSSVVLDNCEISGNTGHYGGGLYLKNGTITMKNGTVVKENSASEGFGGSGIYAEGSGTLIMDGCTFTNNENRNNGQYAVFLCGNANAKISGAPLIYDNKYGSAQHNLYMFQADDQHSYVLINGELTDGAKIGVGQRNNVGEYTRGWKANMGDAEPSDYFVSDNSDYVVFANKDGELEIDYPELSGVSAEGFEGDYDGAEHGITVSAPDGATIKYGTSEDSYTLTENPTYTDAGTYKVYYEVSKENYRAVSGSAEVKINKISATVTITGHVVTADYNGNAHSADGYEAEADTDLYDATKDFTYNGRAEASRTDVGKTYMHLDAESFENTNDNFETVTFNVTDGYVEINPSDAVITTAPKAKDKLVYNGSEQELINAGSADGGTLYYAIGSDDKNAPSDSKFNKEIPTAKDVGNYYIWYMVKADSNHKGISPDCVKVTLAEKEWVTVKGIIHDDDNNPVSDATVSLTMGNNVVDEIISADNGGYYFTAPAGVYNIVVKINGTTITDMVDFSESTTYNVSVSDANTDSVLDVVDSDLNIVVGGLNKEADSIRVRDKVSSDKNVAVRMTVTPVTASSTDAVSAIGEYAADMNLDYYDFKVEKTVDLSTTYLDTTQNVLEIVIPYSFTNKQELTVYCADGSEVKTLTVSDSGEAGTFRVDANAGLVYIYTNQITTYALGYKPYYSVSSELTLGSFTGTVSVKLTKNDETIYELNDVSLDSISFAGVPKGQYSMTITWTDGAENTLTTPFEIN